MTKNENTVVMSQDLAFFLKEAAIDAYHTCQIEIERYKRRIPLMASLEETYGKVDTDIAVQTLTHLLERFTERAVELEGFIAQSTVRSTPFPLGWSSTAS